ncbi:hypothetical protein SESBI_33658 [Sesbania bispinosa]|nr:hypothetical protein SESBI_33658 [Sesbania bispinosa]
MKGKASASEKRIGASKCSSSSSTSRRLLYGCGEEVCLLRSRSIKNPRWFLWRCRNWDVKRDPATIFVGRMMKRQKSSSLDEQKHHSQKKADEWKKKL